MFLEKNIKTARKNKGLTQSELANLLKVSVRTIQNYESGNREPNIDTLKKIADTLNVSLSYLVTNKSFSLDLLSLIQSSYQDIFNKHLKNDSVAEFISENCDIEENKIYDLSNGISLELDDCDLFKVLDFYKAFDPNGFLNLINKIKVGDICSSPNIEKYLNGLNDGYAIGEAINNSNNSTELEAAFELILKESDNSFSDLDPLQYETFKKSLLNYAKFKFNEVKNGDYNGN